MAKIKLSQKLTNEKDFERVGAKREILSNILGR